MSTHIFRGKFSEAFSVLLVKFAMTFSIEPYPDELLLGLRGGRTKKNGLVRRKKLTAQLKDIIDWKGNKYCSEIFG